MAIFHLVNEAGKYMDDKALEQVSGYIIRGAKKTLYYGTSEGFVAEDMAIVQGYYNKADGKKLKHYVISFSKAESPSVSQMESIARKICEEEYSKGYQIIAGIHVKKDQNHLHIMMNTVNAKTAERLHQSRKEFFDERKKIGKLLDDYGIKLED